MRNIIYVFIVTININLCYFQNSSSTDFELPFRGYENILENSDHIITIDSINLLNFFNINIYHSKQANPSIYIPITLENSTKNPDDIQLVNNNLFLIKYDPGWVLHINLNDYSKDLYNDVLTKIYHFSASDKAEGLFAISGILQDFYYFYICNSLKECKLIFGGFRKSYWIYLEMNQLYLVYLDNDWIIKYIKVSDLQDISFTDWVFFDLFPLTDSYILLRKIITTGSINVYHSTSLTRLKIIKFPHYYNVYDIQLIKATDEFLYLITTNYSLFGNHNKEVFAANLKKGYFVKLIEFSSNINKNDGILNIDPSLSNIIILNNYFVKGSKNTSVSLISTNYGFDWFNLMANNPFSPNNQKEKIFLTKKNKNGMEYAPSSYTPWLRASLGYFFDKLETFLFISSDFGMTWRAVLKGSYMLAVLDKGNIFVAIGYNSKSIYFSYDEGVKWNEYIFSPQMYLSIQRLFYKKDSPILNILGKINTNEKYINISIDISKIILVNNCQINQTYSWEMKDIYNDLGGCMNGIRYKFQRKKLQEECRLDYLNPSFNIDFYATLDTCMCTPRDYICQGENIKINGHCVRNPDAGLNNLTCLPGNFFVRKDSNYYLGSANKCKESTQFEPVASHFRIQYCNEKDNKLMILFPTDLRIYDISSNVNFRPTLRIFKNIENKNVLTIIDDYTFDINSPCIYIISQKNKIYKGCNYQNFELIINYKLIYTTSQELKRIEYDSYGGNLIYIENNSIYLHSTFKNFRKLLIIEIHPILPYTLKVYNHPKVNSFLTYAVRNPDNTNEFKYLFLSVEKTYPLTFQGYNFTSLFISDSFKNIYAATGKKLFIISFDLKKYVSREFKEEIKDILVFNREDSENVYIVDKNDVILNINQNFELMASKYTKILYHPLHNTETRECDCPYICTYFLNSIKCLCPDGLTYNQTTNSCSDNLDIFNGLCNPQNDFMCSNGQCIPKKGRCDNIMQCSDFSDEINCKPDCSLDNKVSCSNEDKCIDIDQVCDGVSDCYKASDEENCNQKISLCEQDEFECSPFECISKNELCNGIFDCRNGIDEDQCRNISCDYTQTVCLNKEYKCIPYTYLCDNYNDCFNGEDESFCEKKCIFKCLLGGCITKFEHCNNITDCKFNEDEITCRITDAQDTTKIITIVLFVTTISFIFGAITYCFIDSWKFIKQLRLQLQEQFQQTEQNNVLIESYNNEENPNRNSNYDPYETIYNLSDE